MTAIQFITTYLVCSYFGIAFIAMIVTTNNYKLIYKWYDLWIGLFWDKKKKVLYIFPFPCIGFQLNF